MSSIPFAVDLSVKPEVTAFFDEPTNTVSYIVKDPGSNACAVVDSVMDIDYAAGRIGYDSADAIIAFIRETRPHARMADQRPMSMPTIFRARLTYKESSAERSASAKTSPLCRRPSARFSTKAPNSNGTEVSSTNYSRTATPIGSAQ